MVTAPRGAVLPTVLAVMVIIGLSASAALFMTREEREASHGVRLETLAMAATDLAQVTALARMAPQAHRLQIGEPLSEDIPIEPRVRASARLLRISETLFVLSVGASAVGARGAMARRGASTILRLDMPALAFPAALSLSGGGEAPPSVADGTDHVPMGWPCTPEDSAVPDALHPFASALDSALLVDLHERATYRLAPAVFVRAPGPVERDDECATEVASNWGDPARAGECGWHFPIVHAAGDVTVSGGAGQGVLVVDGDLTVSDGFEFVGAVIVAGAIRIGPGGTRLTGGVRAGSVVDASSGTAALPSIRRSSCALRGALLATAALVPVGDRPWAPER